MGPAKLLVDLRERGVQLAPDHGRLAVEGELDDQDLELLREHKERLLELLRHEAWHGGDPISWPRDDMGSCPTCHRAPAPNGAKPPKVDASWPQHEEDLAPLDNELVRRLEALGYASPPSPNSERQFAKRAGIDPATVAKARKREPVTREVRQKIATTFWEIDEPERCRKAEERERQEAHIRQGKNLHVSLLEDHEKAVYDGHSAQWREVSREGFDCASCWPPPAGPVRSPESSEPETLEKRQAQTPVAVTPLPGPIEEPSVPSALPGESTQDTASGVPPDLLADSEPPDSWGAETGVLLADVTHNGQNPGAAGAAPPTPAASNEKAEFSANAFGHVHKVVARCGDQEVCDLLRIGDDKGCWVVRVEPVSNPSNPLAYLPGRLDIQQGSASDHFWRAFEPALKRHSTAISSALAITASIMRLDWQLRLGAPFANPGTGSTEARPLTPRGTQPVEPGPAEPRPNSPEPAPATAAMATPPSGLRKTPSLSQLRPADLGPSTE